MVVRTTMRITVPAVLTTEELPLDAAAERRTSDEKPSTSESDGQRNGRRITVPAVLTIDKGVHRQVAGKMAAHGPRHRHAVYGPNAIKEPFDEKRRLDISELDVGNSQFQNIAGQPSTKKRRNEAVEEFTQSRKKRARFDEVNNVGSNEVQRNNKPSQAIIRQVSPLPKPWSPKPSEASTAPLSHYIKAAELVVFEKACSSSPCFSFFCRANPPQRSKKSRHRVSRMLQPTTPRSLGANLARLPPQ